MAEISATRLNELDKDEWRELSRRFRPEMTDEQFEADWEEFLAMKRQREAN